MNTHKDLPNRLRAAVQEIEAGRMPHDLHSWLRVAAARMDYLEDTVSTYMDMLDYISLRLKGKHDPYPGTEQLLVWLKGLLKEYERMHPARHLMHTDSFLNDPCRLALKELICCVQAVHEAIPCDDQWESNSCC